VFPRTSGQRGGSTDGECMAKTGRAGRSDGSDAAQDAAEALIQAVYREHGRAMLAYATRLLGDRAAAEDVVQEALIRAWRHPEVLTNGKGSIRGWLLTVIRNLVTDRIRARTARPTEVAETDATPAVERDHADRVVASVTVLEALEGLSEDHRGVLDQLYFQGRSLGETASVLGIPTGTVKSRTYYALQALRRSLNREAMPNVNVVNKGGVTA
jgi:RNA polymerase sigma-70 factor, ECF subfamily